MLPDDNKHPVPDKKDENGGVLGSMNRFLLKVKYSFYSTLVFFLFANPETFAVMQRIFGKIMRITDSHGVPTTFGFFLHVFLFFSVMLGFMLIPSI
jgi:hypothetical protein